MNSIVEIKPGTGVHITLTDHAKIAMRIVAFDGTWVAGKLSSGILAYYPMTNILEILKMTKEEADELHISNW